VKQRVVYLREGVKQRRVLATQRGPSDNTHAAPLDSYTSIEERAF
jgi:hypothetical protein